MKCLQNLTPKVQYQLKDMLCCFIGVFKKCQTFLFYIFFTLNLILLNEKKICQSCNFHF